MKTAALYARVSTDMQKEEGTIKSQLFELRQQISRDGHTLTKEYVDDGWSGGRMDRPALDQLRQDVRANVFDMIYFHAADRIARDIEYQRIIIAELLKYGKQIVINGKEYEQTPEGKMMLTMLGLFAEYEKAKFAERSVRGRRHKVRQGIPATGGNVPYGYALVSKTDNKPQHIIVNEERAAVVRWIYEIYANTEIGINELTRQMQISQALPSHGGRWSRSTVHFILTNTAYYGEIHYYTVRRVPATGSRPRHVKFKTVERDPSEQMTISVPSIVSRELWNKVQAKLERNKRVYRNAPRKYLLSGLVQCARDGKSYTGYTQLWEPGGAARYSHYQCNHNRKMHEAGYSLEKDRCTNKSIVASRIEVGVWLAVVNEILNPARLKTHIELLRTRTRERDDEYRKKLKGIERELRRNQEQKQRLLDLYTDGNKARDMFERKMLNLDEEERGLRQKQVELANTITLVPDPSHIRKSIAVYCGKLSERVSRIVDFAGKRQFLLDVLDSIIFDDDALLIRGFVPLGIQDSGQERARRARDSMRCPVGELI
ncbi:MAG: Site-specific recombinase [Parcubacteria group bacterium GW2011_GWA2_51_10]|nr:MAG: Site-specific recombinase [Parcubacteria group bacterium GW2011_GWA2_51_10]